MNSHPNKEIREVIDDVLSRGWTLKKSGGRAHAWGRLLCPAGDRSGCIISVYSTPRNAQNHAVYIMRRAFACPHTDNEE